MPARIAAAAIPILCLAAGAAASAPLTARCPVEGFTSYRDPGIGGELVVTATAGDPGSVTLSGPWGELKVPARQVMAEGDMAVIQGAGPVVMRMIDRDRLDACLARREREKPGIFKTRLGDQVIVACRSEAGLTPAPVAVDLSIAVMAVQRPEAQMILVRRYPGEQGEAGDRHAARTMAACRFDP